MYHIQEVKQEVLEAIVDKKPFSLIRIGDGEGRILMWPDSIEEHMLNKHLIYWFGKSLQKGDVYRIRENLMDAIDGADIVGINHKPHNKYWTFASSYVTAGGTLNRFKIADINIHKEMWFEDVFKDWTKAAQEVILITCRVSILNEFCKRYPGPTVLVPIPEEANTGRKPTNHWPDVFETVKDIIQRNGSGKLYLIGAGVLGKIYCQLAKEAGSVAVDIGSVFDGFAQITSRSFLSGNLKEWRL